jgi:hypothetical protein
VARALADGAESVQGVLKRVAEGSGELPDANGIILGSPAHHTQLNQAMKRLLSGLSKVALKGKVGAAFGSCGWSGEASAIMVQAFRVIGERLRARRTPSASDPVRCRDLIRTVAGWLVRRWVSQKSWGWIVRLLPGKISYATLRPLKTLRVEIHDNPKRRWKPHTPAVAAGPIDHIWTAKRAADNRRVPPLALNGGTIQSTNMWFLIPRSET